MKGYNYFNERKEERETAVSLDGIVEKKVEKLAKKIENSGFNYIQDNSNTKKNEYEIFFGGYQNKSDYYRLRISDIKYQRQDIKDREGKTIKSNIKLEKLINFDENDASYEKTDNIFTLNDFKSDSRKYNKNIIKAYNQQKDNEMPKIRNYNLNKIMLYSFAAAYGATVVSAVDNTQLVNNAYYGFLHLGMLFVPFLPLQISKKTRSASQLVSLALVSWVANSISYYPIGILMGHTASNIGDMLNWYKFQIGLGSGSYIDKYGPISLKINSTTKAFSYLGRLGLAALFGKISGIKKLKTEVKNGK